MVTCVKVIVLENVMLCITISFPDVHVPPDIVTSPLALTQRIDKPAPTFMVPADIIKFLQQTGFDGEPEEAIVPEAIEKLPQYCSTWVIETVIVLP